MKNQITFAELRIIANLLKASYQGWRNDFQRYYVSDTHHMIATYGSDGTLYEVLDTNIRYHRN